MAKILLVEDDQFISKMFSKKLESAGYQVIVANDGATGLELMKTELPNLVLMDVMMPKLNGIDALEKAKADPATKDIPVLILTNLSSESDEGTAIKKGAVGFIVKSDITPAELVEKVKTYIP